MKTYSQKQRSFNCCIGDTVTVFKVPDDQEMGEWDNYWHPDMNFCIGKSGIVLGIYDHGIHIKFTIDNESRFTFPYFVLNLVR